MSETQELEAGIILRTCPFCGRDPITSKSGEGGRGLMIECLTDGCVNPHVSYYDHKSAVRVWNRRSSSERVAMSAMTDVQLCELYDAVSREITRRDIRYEF